MTDARTAAVEAMREAAADVAGTMASAIRAPAISISYPDLKKLSPCPGRLEAAAAKLGGARKWGATKVTAAGAKAAGVSFGDVVWVASAMARSNADIERRLRLWGADCAARVLYIYERVGKSTAPRNAIIAGRRFARGEIDAAARDAARAAAWAARDAAWAAAWAAGAARAAGGAAWAAAGAAMDAETGWQYDRLVLWLSDDEPDDWPLPEITTKQAAE